MPIQIWRGHHGPEISSLIEEAWKKEELLILCPPLWDSFEFSFLLPKGEIQFVGDWEHTPQGIVSGNEEYPEKPVYGIFSTGTTGRKLVLYSKKNIETSLNAILSLFDETRYSKIFSYPQPFHTFGLILGYCHAFLRDKKLVIPQGKYSAEAHEWWCRESSRELFTLGTPTHFKDLIDFVESNSLSPRPTYSSIIGAARVEKDLWEKCQDVLKIEAPSIGYGATEASPGITHLAPGKAPIEDGEVGEYLSHIEVENQPNGFEFSGSAVCLAMIHQSELEFPKKIFIKDILEKRSDGVLVYKGRADLVLNRGGEKFALEEIENYLKSEMDLDSVCVSLSDSRLGEELGILVRNPSPSKQGVYRLLKTRYGRDFNERYFQVAEEFPINASSKIDRKACKKWMERQIEATPLNH